MPTGLWALLPAPIRGRYDGGTRRTVHPGRVSGANRPIGRHGYLIDQVGESVSELRSSHSLVLFGAPPSIAGAVPGRAFFLIFFSSDERIDTYGMNCAGVVLAEGVSGAPEFTVRCRVLRQRRRPRQAKVALRGREV